MRQFDLSPQSAQEVLAIARQAGQAILAIYRAMRAGDAGLQLANKADNSPLTAADLAAHALIVGALRALSPDTPVVSEEDAERSAAAPEFWLIDPLDGTKEFLSHSDEFTVNIALVRGGRPVFGVVLAPALGLAYWGGIGLGAFREAAGQVAALQVAGLPSDACAIRVVASKSHMNAQTQAFIAKLGTQTLVQAGSSLKFCRIAEGAADIYPRLGLTSEWDTAAAHAIVEAAGGCVVQLDGSPLVYGKADVLNPHFLGCGAPWDAWKKWL